MTKTKRYSLRLDKDMDKWITRKAKAWRMDKSKVVTAALVYYRAMYDINIVAKQVKELGK